jgi:hypothetical protein
MSDDTGKISVIAARLPYTDRRALSEAWFSALHLASDGVLHAQPPERRAGAAHRPRDLSRGPGAQSAAPPAPLQRPAAQRPAAPVRGRDGAALARDDAPRDVRPRSADTRDVFARARSYPSFRTALTFGVAGERVALLLRREGPTLHVVALCRPAVAGIVRRALAGADAALRIRGESIRATVTTVPPGDAA